MTTNMKRREFIRMTGLTGLGVAIAGLGARVPQAMAAGAAQTADPNEKYVMVSNVAAHPYWLDAQYGGEDAAAELGVTWDYTGPADFNTPAQVTQFEQLLATQPAGIIVPALQPDALVAVINQAIEAGIPVVTVDTDAPTSKRMTYLGTNNYQGGRAMGEEMIRVSGGTAKVGLASVPGQFNLEERIRGIEDVFAEAGGTMEVVTVVDDKNDDSATANAVVAMLQANPDIKKGMVCHLDIPHERQEIPCIEDQEILELARYAKRIEEYYRSPQDIEWAIDKHRPFPLNIFMVQSRPETVWSQQKKEPILGKKSAYELLIEKALSRVKISS